MADVESEVAQGGVPKKRTSKSVMADVGSEVAQGGVPKKRTLKSVMADLESETSEIGEASTEPKTTAYERIFKDRKADRDEKELRRLYEHRKRPFQYKCDRFFYKNKAQIRLDKAMAKYHERMKHLSPYDAIDPPYQPNLPCGGGRVRPFTITKAIRPLLISFCHLALDKYNTEEDNQGGANFVFHALVKSTWKATFGPTYYITFQAKANDVTKTFWAQVWNKLPATAPPEVVSCSLKPN